MKEYQEELVKNLPDSYRKDENSNNFKLLEIERTEDQRLRETLAGIESILDLNNATGKTLELYGERVGQARGAATDEQYLIMIKAKILQNLSNGSYKSVVKSICSMLSCDPSEVQLTESDKPCTIEVAQVPLDTVITAGFTVYQINQLIKRVLPVGITIENILYEGTFEFSSQEQEYDENKGFAEKENASAEDIGGHLGMLAGEDNDTILPI